MVPRYPTSYFPELGTERFRCVHLANKLVVFLHERFDRLLTRTGERSLWIQLGSVVDNGLGLYAAEHTRFSETQVLANSEITAAVYAAIKAAAKKEIP